MESPVDTVVGQSYVTVIPVDYPRSRAVSQPADYLVEQYGEFVGDRTREEYMRGDYNINSSPADSNKEDLCSIYSGQRFEQGKPQSTSFEREKNTPMTFERDKQCSNGGGLTHQDWNSDKPKPMTFERENKPPPISFNHDPGPDWDPSNRGAGDGSDADAKSQLDQPNTPLQPLHVCVYLMSRMVVHMDIQDGGDATALDVLNTLLQEEELGLSSAANIFSLWMSSPLLEVQLKPHQRPLRICQQWPALITNYASASESRMEKDEPVLSFQRNVFFSKRDEERIKDQKILDLLYEEARFNVIEGRYPCEVSHYIMLGGVQARIQLGPYNPQIHTIPYFREHASEFLPRHVCRSAWAWLRMSGKNSPEVRLLEQYKRIPSITPTRKLVRKYLEFCWSLPFYGSAFFQGQVEQPVRGLTSLLTHQDVPVLVAINAHGIYVIDSVQCTLFLGLKYEELSWEFAKPSQEDNPNCLPCLFLQFMVLENGARVSKILQVFSKQAVMMDALISVFVEEAKLKPPANGADETDRPIYDTSTDSDDTQVPLTTVNRREAPQSCLSNKLSKLTLATFDEEVDLHEKV